MLLGGGGLGGRISHAPGAACAPASANMVRGDRQISVELIAHPIPPTPAAPDYPFWIAAEDLTFSEVGVARVVSPAQSHTRLITKARCPLQCGLCREVPARAGIMRMSAL
jgi:hypothetical protein